jgi:hypothetical protein
VTGYNGTCKCECDFPFSGTDCAVKNSTCIVAWNGLSCGPNSLALDYNSKTN